MCLRCRLGVRLQPFIVAMSMAVVLAVVFNCLAVPVRARAETTKDTKGTDFWLTFMQNYDQAQNDTLPLTLTLFITGERTTDGTVLVPGEPPAAFHVDAGQVTSVVIPPTAQLSDNDTVQNKGIHVTALDEVTVYGLNRRKTSTDAYLGLPTDILGLEYIMLGYANSSSSSPANQTEFAIVGTETGTIVTITPTTLAGSHPAGVPFDVTLDAGQTYQLQDASSNVDLSGTIITATHPIAVFGGHSCADIPQETEACDHVVEELTPTSTWGKNFVTMPLATRTAGDTFRFLAQKNGTQVSIDGVVVATIDRGQFYETPSVLNEDFIEKRVVMPMVVTADKPILVAQYSNGTRFDNITSDPFMVLVPPTEQFQASYTVTTPVSGFAANFVNLVVPTVSVGFVTVDGVAVTGFTPIGTSGFSGAQVSVSLHAHTVSGPLPFGITVYGFDTDDSYGYPGGMSLAPIAGIDAVDDSGAAVNGFAGGTSVATVLTNDTLVGAPVDPALVTASQQSTTSPGVTLNAATGAVVVAPGTAAGDYQLVYKLCENANQFHCDTATVTVPVTAAVIDAVDDTGASVDGTTGGTSFADALANDTLNGASIAGNTVSLSQVSASPGVTLNTTTGAVSVAPGTPASGGTPYTLVYKICELLNPSNCDTASVTVPVTAAPSLSLTKTTASTTYSAVGNVIAYSYAVKNTGTMTLAGPVTVTDNRTLVSCPPGGLAVGTTMTCLANYSITQVDLDAGSVTNTAQAHANGTDSNTDSRTVVAIQSPSLDLVKAATPKTYTALGDVINYLYKVTNTGNVTLVAPFTVSDNKTTATCPATASLAPSAFITCTGSHTIVQADLTAGAVTNVASAKAFFGTAPVVSPSATVTVTATPASQPPPPTQSCVRDLEFWFNHPDQWPVSSLTLGTVTYSKAQLLKILEYATRPDVRIKSGLAILAGDLIVAKLNQAAGAPVPAAVAIVIAAADSLIGHNVLPPIGFCTVSTVTANALDCLLAAYNQGEARGGPPSCRDCASSQDAHRGDERDKDGKDDRDGKNGKDKYDDHDARDGRDGKDEKDERSCVSAGHYDGDNCISGHHGHTVGDRCFGAGGVHHDGDGCDPRNTEHIKCIKKEDASRHRDGDGCIPGHHGHTVGDHCQGADGQHHDGDGCDVRNSAHTAAIKKEKSGR